MLYRNKEGSQRLHRPVATVPLALQAVRLALQVILILLAVFLLAPQLVRFTPQALVLAAPVPFKAVGTAGACRRVITLPAGPAGNEPGAVEWTT